MFFAPPGMANENNNGACSTKDFVTKMAPPKIPEQIKKSPPAKAKSPKPAPKTLDFADPQDPKIRHSYVVQKPLSSPRMTPKDKFAHLLSTLMKNSDSDETQNANEVASADRKAAAAIAKENKISSANVPRG